jgi:hypothetical protein
VRSEAVVERALQSGGIVRLRSDRQSVGPSTSSSTSACTLACPVRCRTADSSNP